MLSSGKQNDIDVAGRKEFVLAGFFLQYRQFGVLQAE